MCSYHGPGFGANYPDAMCDDGYLWDLDSCDEPGGALMSGGDIPCPNCNTREYIEYRDWSYSGNSKQRRRLIRVDVARIQRKAAEYA